VVSGRYGSLLIIQIFKDNVLSLHPIKQETGLDPDARSWALHMLLHGFLAEFWAGSLLSGHS